MPEKPVHWVGAARKELRAFSALARRRAGYELFRVQTGHAPTDGKPMASVGPGVQEIRIQADGAYRVFFVAKYEEAVYVLHAFEKKSRRTPKAAIEMGKQRLRTLQQARRKRSR